MAFRRKCALPYLEQSCGVGTDTEGARAKLRAAGVAVGPQLPAWSSTGERRTREPKTAKGNGWDLSRHLSGGTYLGHLVRRAPIRATVNA